MGHGKGKSCSLSPPPPDLPKFESGDFSFQALGPGVEVHIIFDQDMDTTVEPNLANIQYNTNLGVFVPTGQSWTNSREHLSYSVPTGDPDWLNFQLLNADAGLRGTNQILVAPFTTPNLPKV